MKDNVKLKIQRELNKMCAQRQGVVIHKVTTQLKNFGNI